ncbi:hypothetical protein M9H77_31405 [Catharanthus roseus]|uniref:Uncharacterized protein n=1 Tax=Catharanthus roseus TaxID=4058 RepID=A0ACC0A482_CATRO|nr:hypothetical protein M9H77_31405 [Catharanthus roseus]
MEIIPNLFNSIGWVSLLTIDELYYPEMICEFYANLHKGRTEKVGNITHQWVLSRIAGRDITLIDGIRFYTKNKKYFDPNLYSERRFEEIFSKGEENEFWVYCHRAYTSYTILIHQMFVVWLLPYQDLSSFCGQDDSDEDDNNDEKNEEQEGMNVAEEESDTEPEVETHRREIRQKKRQEKMEEGSSSVDMAQVMARFIIMQSQLNSRLDDRDGKLQN